MTHTESQKALDHIRYVFLDRDGVINRKAPEGQYIGTWRDFVLLPGVVQAIAYLNQSQRKVIVVTNQRGIALGHYSQSDLEDIHGHLQALLSLHDAHVDAIYICPHDKNECECRKPGTALFLQAFADFPGAHVHNSVLFGDSLSDIQAGERLGMPAFFIRGDASTSKPGSDKAEKLANDVFDSLQEAVFSLF